MSNWPPLWHPKWITSAIPCKVSVPHTLFTAFNSYYLSEYRRFEAATNPTALHLLSVNRTGVLSILQISSPAVEIHPIFVGLILVSPSKMGKNPIGLRGNTKRYTTELGAGFVFGGRGELHSGRSLPPKSPGVLQRDRRSRTARCMSVLSRDVSGRVICPQLR